VNGHDDHPPPTRKILHRLRLSARGSSSEETALPTHALTLWDGCEKQHTLKHIKAA
jgi:hypothetical protein